MGTCKKRNTTRRAIPRIAATSPSVFSKRFGAGRAPRKAFSREEDGVFISQSRPRARFRRSWITFKSASKNVFLSILDFPMARS